MRRTVLSAMALACTAVLAGTVPAFADDPSPVPTERPTASTAPAPSAEPSEAPTSAAPAPSAEPTRAPSGQVSVVPSGAPDTGVTADSASSGSGSEAGLIGGGATALLLGSGGAVFVVRRRRATGA